MKIKKNQCCSLLATVTLTVPQGLQPTVVTACGESLMGARCLVLFSNFEKGNKSTNTL